MKLFTIDQANELLPVVRRHLVAIQDLYLRLEPMVSHARCAASANMAGGGMPGGSDYVRTLYEIGRVTTELDELGVQLKDHTRGLVDFPCLRNDRIILLCWQFDDGDSIEWWHEEEAGFAGRQRL